MNLTGTTSENFLTPLGESIKGQIAYYTNVLSLNETLGCSPITYDPYIPTALPSSLYNLYIEKMVPKMVFEANNNFNTTEYFISNSATLRYDLYEGRVDVNDIFSVNPFADMYVYFQPLNGTQLKAIVRYSESYALPPPPSCLAAPHIAVLGTHNLCIFADNRQRCCAGPQQESGSQ